MHVLMNGEPGKAPACSLKSPSAATTVPSRLTPIFTVIDAPEVGPVALNTSSRLITIFTGRPDWRARMTATGSTELFAKVGDGMRG